MQKRWQLKFQTFEKNFNNFAELAEMNLQDYDPAYKDAFIKRLERVLNSARKLLQAYMNEQGIWQEFSYRPLLRHAYKYGYIESARVWIHTLDHKKKVEKSFLLDEKTLDEAVFFLQNSFYPNLKYTYKFFKQKIILSRAAPYKFGLKEKEWSEIKRVLSAFKEVEECVIYGSRCTGAFTKISDIDLAVKGAKIDWDIIMNLKQAFDVSSLPYLVDVTHYHTIDKGEFKNHIDIHGIPIYPQAAQKHGAPELAAI